MDEKHTSSEIETGESLAAEVHLVDTPVFRDPVAELDRRSGSAAYSLAAGRRTVRLLWISLIVSLFGNLIIPVCIVMAMVRPEKVALMDGTESLIIAPLVPIEESNEILETVSLWAAKSFLDRGPQGFDTEPEACTKSFSRAKQAVSVRRCGLRVWSARAALNAKTRVKFDALHNDIPGWRSPGPGGCESEPCFQGRPDPSEPG